MGPGSTGPPSGQELLPQRFTRELVLRVGEIAGAGEPTIRVFKTVTTADGTCGVDDVEELSVTAGTQVKYCYSVVNDGTYPLYDVTLEDDNGTNADAAPPTRPRIRALAFIPDTDLELSSQDRFLYITQWIPADLADNALAVQSAYREYQQRSLARSGLRQTG